MDRISEKTAALMMATHRADVEAGVTYRGPKTNGRHMAVGAMLVVVILGLLVFAGAARANDVISTAQNQDGGSIRFTNVLCQGGDGMVVFSVGKGGSIGHRGCWVPMDEEVFVDWKDGTFYSYPYSALTLTEYGRKRHEARRARKLGDVDL